MKKILCVLLSLIMSASLIAIPLSAQAETKYWVDMNFAKDNIEGLRNYIKTACSKYFKLNKESATHACEELLTDLLTIQALLYKIYNQHNILIHF